MKVLFVCAGNICRSPMAEAVFLREAPFHAALADVETASAGVIGLDGNLPVETAVEVLRSECGLDMSAHRASRLLTSEPADLVLTLDQWVQEQAAALGLAGRVELLGHYAGFAGEEVPDPYGGPEDRYRSAARQIERLVKATVERLSRELSGFDLAAYLDRIGAPGDARPDLTTLRAVHAAHLGAIPFENVDIQLGRAIRLDVAALQDKLVRQRRGGYCFEQNTLFLHALRAIGFDVVACEARVILPSGKVTPRTHMLLVATLNADDWLCDVGFGGDGPLEPVRLDGTEHVEGTWTYRVAGIGDAHVLHVRRQDRWQPLYSFAPARRYPVDFELANWFTSTHPQSRFVLTLTAQRSTRERRDILRNLTLEVVRAGSLERREIPREELVPLLRHTFSIDVAADSRFRAIDG